ncbi:hypothetical protein [Phocaeicola sartorii]|uniref:hypothetical protein n=1 Tax=Phocaeicola sartorii TaxID=671267 RepID=UPI001F56C458|nr:hypothetical protein [Phocaeicola sartorii]
MGKKEYLYQVSIDALEITYTTTDEMKEYLSSDDSTYYFGEKKEIILKRSDSRYYKNEFIIWCKDWNESKGHFKRIVGYMRFGSFNKNRQNVYITYENEALYSWLVSARYYMEEALNLEFLQISKFDIAVDFNFNVEKHLIRQYKDDSYDLIVNGRLADNKAVYGVGFLSWWNPRHRIFANPQMLVKNDKSTLTMKTYNKKKEIEQESGKYYIQEKTGFNTIMYRVEITCKNHKLLKKTLDALEISDEFLYVHLDDENVLLTVFSHLLDRVIHLRKNRKPINILDEALKGL